MPNIQAAIQRRILIQTLMKSYQVAVKDLAALCNVSSPMISAVIAGRKRSNRIEKSICRVLGVRHAHVWGKQS